jgi:hypothetical protein
MFPKVASLTDLDLNVGVAKEKPTTVLPSYWGEELI